MCHHRSIKPAAETLDRRVKRKICTLRSLIEMDPFTLPLNNQLRREQSEPYFASKSSKTFLLRNLDRLNFQNSDRIYRSIPIGLDSHRFLDT